MPIHKYLANYPPAIIEQAQALIDKNRLADVLLSRYPSTHNIANDNELRQYVVAIKNRHMQKSVPLSKVIYDSKIHVIHNALGLHSYVSRVQGGKLKSKNEIRIGTVFKKAPEDFLKMIVVHELAHLKEKAHNKAFYRLCNHMLPNYHQLEFDMRLYLIQLEAYGAIYPN
ncbi:MAG TPA: YgjP-like metallopeptidase domain-containing protein [Marinagarivorans sp.]